MRKIKKKGTPTKTMGYKGNIGLWFWKTFIRDFLNEPENIPEQDLKIWVHINTKWLKETQLTTFSTQTAHFKEVFKGAVSPISLKTTYPGLVCGVGYEHEIGFKGEFKLGFSFDHTTGLPFIPGSSVKGVLRSAFRHHDYIKGVIRSEQINNSNSIDIPELERHLFDGIDYTTGRKLSTYGRVVFHDAFICKSDHTDNLFLADDYITSHQNIDNPTMSPFTNPNPVRFIKVLSNVVFCFPIQVSGTNTLNNREILSLFKSILMDFGIGAKTNVGYGQLDAI